MGEAMKHTINLVTGDWSGDGHSQTSTQMIRSNLTRKELEGAYKKGAKKTGVDLTNGVAEDYEDSSFPHEDIEKLRDHGFKPEDYLDEYEEGMPGGLDSESFYKVWLFIATVGDPRFKYEEVQGESINVGGYGVFFS
jgi:hypothetical protein